MIILLVSTFEAQPTHIVQQVINTSEQQELLERVFYQGRGLRDQLTEVVSDHPEIYGKQNVERTLSGSYGESMAATLQEGRIMECMNHSFDTLFKRLLPSLATIPQNEKIIITYPHLSFKPTQVDHFIGWTVDKSDFGITHMKEHENIEGDVAKEVSDIHNKWMNHHQHIYDKFFDCADASDVIYYIKQL